MAAPPPPSNQEDAFTAIDSPSLQFLPRRDEATGWQLEQDPIVIPANRLGTYLDADAQHFAHYEVLDGTIGNYTATTGEGFATVEIYRFPDFVKAFGAYSTRKTPNVQFLNIANEAFQTAHSIHLWRGPFYVRVIGTTTLPGALNLSMPDLPPHVLPLLEVVPCQVLAHDLAVQADIQPGRVRYIQQVITTEAGLPNAGRA